ncbi:MAG: hypothetical protein R3F56_04390 [Planctomycetota bacterium]
MMTMTEAAEFEGQLLSDAVLARDVAEARSLWRSLHGGAVSERLDSIARLRPELLSSLVDRELERGDLEIPPYRPVLEQIRADAERARQEREAEQREREGPQRPEQERDRDIEPEP